MLFEFIFDICIVHNTCHYNKIYLLTYLLTYVLKSFKTFYDSKNAGKCSNYRFIVNYMKFCRREAIANFLFSLVSLVK